MDSTPKIGIVILAAGASRRMGQAKQLLEYKGKTLIENICDLALSVDTKSVVVVLGANELLISEKLVKYKDQIEILSNPDWKEGMSTSLSVGIKYLLNQNPLFSHFLVLLVDQPFVTPDLLAEIKQGALKHPDKIIASQYDQTLGVPAIFPKPYFKDLLSIDGDKGARKVLIKYEDEVIPVVFSKGKIDLDTLEDYHDLIN